MFPRQEKNFMKDPATANSRIYVGNLEQTVTEDDLQTLFSPYGKILGICVQRNFGFIQFDTEQSAQLAIQKQLGAVFKGKKLNVRAAITGEGGKGNNTKNQLTPNAPDSVDQEQHSNTGTGGNIYPRRPRGAMAPRGGRGGGGGGGGGNTSTPMRSGFRDRSPINRNENYGYNRDESSYKSNFNREPYTANVAPTTPVAVPPRRKADCNDCEIIVVAKSLTEYAEYIEQKLKNVGLSVDLLFPNEDVPIGRVLANIASRGCLYAILVTPQNEEHASLTLNILHGLSQEHRNMPTEDAINLISRNFEAYMRGDKHIPGSATLGSIYERHPEAIQVLLNLLAENRQLTVLQYDRIIKYIQERRELQLKHELGDAADEIDTPSSVNTSSKAAELQNRILSILNSTTPSTHATSADSVTPSSNSATASAIAQILPTLASSVSKLASTNSSTSNTNTNTTASTPAPLLNDPSVQKALDSLLQADLLKNIVKPSQSTPTNSSSNENYGTNYSANVRRF